MMYMGKQKIIKAYNKGQLDEVAKQLRTYGQIVADKAWDEEVGHYAGSHRVLQIVHDGLEWCLTMWNGEVHEVGYSKNNV